MNVADIFEDSATRYGEYNACHYEGKWYTNFEMNRLAMRLAGGLKKLGICRGDRIITQLPNCVEAVVTFNAAFRTGAAVVPITPLLRPEQTAHIYSDSGAALVVTTSDNLPRVREARKTAPNLHTVIVVDEDEVTDTIRFNQLIQSRDEELRVEEMDLDDLATLIYTSGTTGNPKGVIHTQSTLWESVLARYYQACIHQSITLSNATTAKPRGKYGDLVESRVVTGINRAGLSLVVLPLSHAFGIGFLTFLQFVGGAFYIMKRWNPLDALKIIQDFRIDNVALVPTMYIQLLDHPDFDQYDLSSLRVCNCGSAPLPREIGMKWKDRVGVDIHEGWGMSESFAAGTYNTVDLPPKYGSIGKMALPGHQIRIVDDLDNEVPQGQAGELVLKGPSIMKGYWNLPEETSQTLRKGWLHSGDVAYKDPDGYYYIIDRKKDLIIRGGENVSPAEVEDVVCRHVSIAESACVGIPDRVYGEEIVVYAVLKPGRQCTDRELIEFCKAFLPTFKLPKSVQFVPELPKNLLGKILRAELRKLASN